jgi:hypothetical protein
VASLLQPAVAQYEVAPWPERIFNGAYPRSVPRSERRSIPPAYATELQLVMNALNDFKQSRVEWNCGTRGIGVLVSDSLMFQRGEPNGSDPHLSQVYGLALPLVKRGMPVTPVQLENVVISNYLSAFRVLILSYHGQKPLSPEPDEALARWVHAGGVLVMVDDDADPYNSVRDWWNSSGQNWSTPRKHLFRQLGLDDSGAAGKFAKVGKGAVYYLKEDPSAVAADPEGDKRLAAVLKEAAGIAKLGWRESNALVLRRGPYIIGAGLDESIAGRPVSLSGRFVNLFDPELKVIRTATLAPGSRWVLLDLQAGKQPEPALLACAGKPAHISAGAGELSFSVEGVSETPGVVLIGTNKRSPKKVDLDGQALNTWSYSETEGLLWIHFKNQSSPQRFLIRF